MDKILITVRLYSGIEKEVIIENYDVEKGIVIYVNIGTRLGKILKSIGLKNLSRFCFFSNGMRISQWTRMNEQSDVSCLKISGGG